LGKGPFANPGAPLTDAMRSALAENLVAAQNNLQLAQQGSNRDGNAIPPEMAARIAQSAQNRINEIQQVLQSGVQAPRN